MHIKKRKMERYSGIAYYRKEDWDRHVQLADDRAGLHNCWEDWLESAHQLKWEAESLGFQTQFIIIDLNQLMQYCVANKLPNIGATRAEYVTKLVQILEMKGK
jgi:hypothetical protein